MVSMEEQQLVFQRVEDGRRKIVIATNIAETSITIDDVVYVIDSGKIKLKVFDARKNISSLEDKWVSKANAKQRKGRAGRLKPGICYRIYSRMQPLPDQHRPEMLRTRFENLCLNIKFLNQGKIKPFFQKAMEPPHIHAIEKSIEHLQKLNALDANEELTPLGTQLGRLPVDPHIGKMMLFGAIFGCLGPVLTIAACLDHKSPFNNPMEKQLRPKADKAKQDVARGSSSDHLMFSHAYDGWQDAKQFGDAAEYCRKKFLSRDTLNEIRKRREQFSKILCDLGYIEYDSPDDRDANVNARHENVLRGVVCAGLYPNVAVVRTKRMVLSLGHQYNTIFTGDDEVEIHVKSVNCKQTLPYGYLVYFNKMKTKAVNLFDTSAVSLTPIMFFGKDLELLTSDEFGHIELKVDNLVSFKTTPQRALELTRLRCDLWEVLQQKLDHPSPTTWDDSYNEGFILSTIVEKLKADERVDVSGQ